MESNKKGFNLLSQNNKFSDALQSAGDSERAGRRETIKNVWQKNPRTLIMFANKEKLKRAEERAREGEREREVVTQFYYIPCQQSLPKEEGKRENKIERITYLLQFQRFSPAIVFPEKNECVELYCQIILRRRRRRSRCGSQCTWRRGPSPTSNTMLQKETFEKEMTSREKTNLCLFSLSLSNTYEYAMRFSPIE